MSELYVIVCVQSWEQMRGLRVLRHVCQRTKNELAGESKGLEKLSDAGPFT